MIHDQLELEEATGRDVDAWMRRQIPGMSIVVDDVLGRLFFHPDSDFVLNELGDREVNLSVKLPISLRQLQEFINHLKPDVLAVTPAARKREAAYWRELAREPSEEDEEGF